MEFEYVENFKRIAPSLEPNTPNLDDRLAWLFLMQHHRAPTRLLDWSESILVALYFAVEQNLDEHGELWSFYPTELNAQSGLRGIPLPDHPLIKYLVHEHTKHDPEKLKDELKLKERPTRPVALMPGLYFPRIVSQHSTFTIHPVPTEGNTIPELLTDPKILLKYRVPRGAKEKIKADLSALGITKRTMFQDLASLSDSLIEAQKIVGFSPPNPPKLSD